MKRRGCERRRKPPDPDTRVTFSRDWLEDRTRFLNGTQYVHGTKIEHHISRCMVFNHSCTGYGTIIVARDKIIVVQETIIAVRDTMKLYGTQSLLYGTQ